MSTVVNELSSASSTEYKKAEEYSAMGSEAKMLAYAKWHELLTDPEILMNAEERYDELLRLSDEYVCRGIIDRSKRNTLIEIATAAYARSVADLST